jgi:hypothetical protein
MYIGPAEVRWAHAAPRYTPSYCADPARSRSSMTSHDLWTRIKTNAFLPTM